MSAIVADTHSILWYLGAPQVLSPSALATMRSCASSGEPIYVSAITVAEVTYLVEKGKVSAAALATLDRNLDDPASVVQTTPFDLPVARTLAQIPRADVPDMPDRIIAATALYLGLPLGTRDARIRSSHIVTIW